jgi:flagellin-specific chaperone FliS
MSLLHMSYAVPMRTRGRPTRVVTRASSSIDDYDVDRLIKQNKRLEKAMKKVPRYKFEREQQRVNKALVELISFLELMEEDTVEEIPDSILEMYDFCGEVPDDIVCRMYDY